MRHQSGIEQNDIVLCKVLSKRFCQSKSISRNIHLDIYLSRKPN